MEISQEEYLAHYGILRKSGRYPWGSGANPNQRSRTFLDIVNDLEKNHGMSKKEIAKSFSTDDDPFTTTDLVRLRSIASNIQKQDQIRTVQKLKDKGMGDSEIARQMGLNESTVRSLSEPGRLEKLNILQNTADMLKRQVEEKGFVDVGVHVEKDLPIGENPATRAGISTDKFRTALAMLREEGYPVHQVPVPQVGTGDNTNFLVLTKPGTTQLEAFKNRHNIRQISEKTEDHGRTFKDDALQPPLNISSKRVGINYKEDGGADADGVIYVRPGVKDVSLGQSNYAQVRIAVDNSHYLKGMAVYKDDLPPGIDLMFNTNKSNTGNKLDAMKPFKAEGPDKIVDPINPFGASLQGKGQIKDANNKVTSVMNKINEEGDWDTWSKNLSRQVLSKQEPALIKTQLELTHERRLSEFEKIKSLTNPQVRKTLLKTFSDETDAAAVDLEAVHMPRQATKVILPSNKVKVGEIFAPTFRDGENVALIRFPHAGRFEIPELTVNNKTREARKLVGHAAIDAVVINPKVAARLSGADFDGDHVVVIPNDRRSIKSANALEDLKGFDPHSFAVPLGPKTKKYPDGTPTIDDQRKQNEMGLITNLISDMTIRGANTHEIARAVKHSMVVIDSEKHNLNFKASEEQHGIRDLRKKYQGVHPSGMLKGASTLITRATADKRINDRKARLAGEGGPIDRKTGKKMFVDTGKHTVKYPDPSGTINPKNGKVRTITKRFLSKEAADQYVQDNNIAKAKVEPKKIRVDRLAVTDDAFSLISDVKAVEERLYARHSNNLKALANEARLEMINTKDIPYNKSAKEVYSKEVESLNSKLSIAESNAPLERQAQVVANAIVSQRRRANPDMDRDTEKKIRGQALDEARIRTGAGKERIPITQKEWDAIQAGAISTHKLERILKNTDIDRVRELATPRQRTVMTSVMTTRAKQMLANGYTPSEVSDSLGIPLSTLTSAILREGE